VAGDAAVGEEIGRVGEDEVDGRFGNLGEDFQAVAVIDAEVVFGVVESGGGKSRRGGAIGAIGIGDGFGHEWLINRDGWSEG
jgi:hypothetical protein